MLYERIAVLISLNGAKSYIMSTYNKKEDMKYGVNKVFEACVVGYTRTIIYLEVR